MIHNSGRKTDTASLVLVGTGIKCIAHLTIEAKNYIQKSTKVLYLVNDLAIEAWIQKNNSNATSLDFLYKKYDLRLHCYEAITNYILEAVREIQHVCVVMYGHPAVFAQPGLAAVKIARQEGFYATILPGISAEDCLFADLLIDPGEYGCQSFEATDFLLRMRQVDITSHLILWQVGIIGMLGHYVETTHSKITVLTEYLLQFYPENHPFIVYEAAQYPHLEPKIIENHLIKLEETALSRLSTLYIPPIGKKCIDSHMQKKLGIKQEDLK